MLSVSDAPNRKHAVSPRSRSCASSRTHESGRDGAYASCGRVIVSIRGASTRTAMRASTLISPLFSPIGASPSDSTSAVAMTDAVFLPAASASVSSVTGTCCTSCISFPSAPTASAVTVNVPSETAVSPPTRMSRIWHAPEARSTPAIFGTLMSSRMRTVSCPSTS